MGIRAVLVGEESVEIRRDERTVLDVVRRQYDLADKAEQARMASEFAGLLQDPDPKVRAAAVVFFSKSSNADEYDALFAAWQRLDLYDGVTHDWYPNEPDLRGSLAMALSKRTLRLARHEVREAMKVEAMVPGRGQFVLSALIPADPEWVVANYVEVVLRSPEALPGLLMWLGFLDVTAEQVLDPAVSRLPESTVRRAILSAVPKRADELIAKYYGDPSPE